MNYADPTFLSYHDLKLAMLKAIEERGENYIYKNDPRWQHPAMEWYTPNCAYTHGDWSDKTKRQVLNGDFEVTFACAIGAIWDKTGFMSLEEASMVDDGIEDILTNGTMKSDVQGKIFATCLQLMQDGGFPWGITYDAAVHAAETLGPDHVWTEKSYDEGEVQTKPSAEVAHEIALAYGYQYYWPHLRKPARDNPWKE